MDCFYTIRISRNKLYEHNQKLFFRCVFVVMVVQNLLQLG